MCLLRLVDENRATSISVYQAHTRSRRSVAADQVVLLWSAARVLREWLFSIMPMIEGMAEKYSATSLRAILSTVVL